MENQDKIKDCYNEKDNPTSKEHCPKEISELDRDSHCESEVIDPYVISEDAMIDDEELKYLNENDYGAINGKVLDYDSEEYKATGTLKPAWGDSSAAEEKSIYLSKGTIIAQWSEPGKSGTYFCPMGTNYKDLQLPNIQEKRLCKFFVVTQDSGLKVLESEIAVQPWNKTNTSAEGTGVMQWRTSERADELVKKGMLKEITKEIIDTDNKTLIKKCTATKLVIFLGLIAAFCTSYYLTDTSNSYNFVGWIISTLGVFIFPLIICSKFPSVARSMNSKNGGIALIICMLILIVISIFLAKVIAVGLFILVGYWIITAGTSIAGAFTPTGRIHVERHEEDGSISVEDHYVYEDSMPSEISKIETQLKNEGYTVKNDN